jgi:hypothetical protein
MATLEREPAFSVGHFWILHVNLMLGKYWRGVTACYPAGSGFWAEEKPLRANERSFHVADVQIHGRNIKSSTGKTSLTSFCCCAHGSMLATAGKMWASCTLEKHHALNIVTGAINILQNIITLQYWIKCEKLYIKMTWKPHSVQQNNYKFHTATKINLYRNSSAVATTLMGWNLWRLRSRQSNCNNCQNQQY